MGIVDDVLKELNTKKLQSELDSILEKQEAERDPVQDYIDYFYRSMNELWEMTHYVPGYHMKPFCQVSFSRIPHPLDYKRAIELAYQDLAKKLMEELTNGRHIVNFKPFIPPFEMFRAWENERRFIHLWENPEYYGVPLKIMFYLHIEAVTVDAYPIMHTTSWLPDCPDINDHTIAEMARATCKRLLQPSWWLKWIEGRAKQVDRDKRNFKA